MFFFWLLLGSSCWVLMISLALHEPESHQYRHLPAPLRAALHHWEGLTSRTPVSCLACRSPAFAGVLRTGVPGGIDNRKCRYIHFRQLVVIHTTTMIAGWYWLLQSSRLIYRSDSSKQECMIARSCCFLCIMAKAITIYV